MTEKIEVSKELFDIYNQEYKGNWGKMIRDWRYWIDCNLQSSDKEKKKNELFDIINLSVGCGLPASDIIPMIITGQVEIIEKQEPKEWTVYFDQRYQDSDTFRYFYWDGEHINQGDNLENVPLLTMEQARKAPDFMKSLVKKGK